MLLSVINFGPTNRAITNATTNILSNKIGSKVSIGEVEIGLFNRVILKDVKVYDKHKETLLKADLMTAKIELRSLFRKPLSLRTISLLDADINLYKQSITAPANFQFIIDAFASKKPSEKSALNLRINSLILRRVNVKYNELYKTESPRLLNPSHLNLSEINANISLKEITSDSLRLNIRSLAFKERSGFILQNLRLRMKANRTQANIADFEIILGKSKIQLKDVTAQYNARKNWKELLNTLHTSGFLYKAQIATSDLQHLVKLPENLDLIAQISTKFNVTPQQFSLTDFRINDYAGNLALHADAILWRTKGKFSGINADLKRLNINKALSSHIVESVTADTSTVNLVKRLGNIKLTGKSTYKSNANGSAQIYLQCEGGLVALNASLHNHNFQSDVKITNANPAYILNNPKLPSLLSASGKLSGIEKDHKIMQAMWTLTANNILWNNYKYKSLTTKGKLTANHIEASIDSKDPNALFNIFTNIGLVGRKVNSLILYGIAERISPATLNFKTPYGNALFQGKINANIANMLSTPTGSLHVNDFEMAGAPQGNYHLGELNAQLSASSRQQGTLLLNSDFIDAEVHGPMSIQRLVNGIAAIAQKSLPGLMNKRAEKALRTDEWKFKANVKNTEIIRKMLGVDLQLTDGLQLHGILNAADGRTSISLLTNGIEANGNKFGKSSVYLSGQGSNYHCLLQTSKDFSSKKITLAATLRSIDSTLVTQVNWQENGNNNYTGAFRSTTRFVSNRKDVNFTMDIHPTKFALDGAEWNISSGQLSLLDKELAFKNVKIGRQNQHLSIDGRLSPHQNDSIIAQLNNIDIEYILDLVDFQAVDFGGQATGDAVFTKSAQNPELHARLHIPDFTFNQGLMGSTEIIGSWNKKENRILLDADMKLPQGNGTGTKVNGYVSLAEKGLELNILANRTNLKFLRRYMDGIFDNFDGEATGNVRLYGPFKRLDFEGALKADAKARIMATGVSYEVKDGDVTLSPGEFAFHNFKISDYKQGTGKADGYLRHTHLKNLNYRFSVSADNLLCYDMPQSLDLPFYSTTTGSGNVSLQGYPGHFSADISLRPTSPTTLVYTLGTPEATSTSDNMIRFHNGEMAANTTATDLSINADGETSHITAATPKAEAPESTTDIVMNFLIDTNPSAQVKIITDPRSGDAITAYGEGPIRASFHNKGNFEMYGTYRLTRGTYKFSIQDVIRKDLILQPGSTITFGGPPMLADLGLKALYTVNGVSLSDLNYGAGFSQKSVRVDCILNIGGKAQAPQVNFDLDLHNISEDEKQMVRQLIATDEDMNRQVIYLLGIGRFYTANTQTSEGQITSQQQSTAAMRSFLSTTLTSQLNSAISSALGSQSHWSFGTNVAAGSYGWNDFEVDGLLQGRLFNDRLLINGNFGYRDRPTYTSNFVGDFDIQYLLTPRGSVSLKAYSETSDRYFTKSSLTTQGVGIMLQRDFNNFRDLFNIRKRKGKARKKASK